LRNGNHIKPSLYSFNLVNIIDEYDRFIKNDKEERKDILKVFHGIDLFETNISFDGSFIKRLK